MNEDVRMHYERHPYPHFSYLASVRRCDTYALNLESLWARVNGEFPPPGGQRILLAGCGSFSPYPTSLANPRADITALDLSRANLRRARIHALLHGRCNISYQQGDLLDPMVAPGPYAFIDAFGVLHHLPDPLAGLRALERRLAPGGIIRIMVYSRYARRDEESIRRALRLLGISDTRSLGRLARKAGKDSRFGDYLRTSSEARHPGELADALLHPQVTTFRIDELFAMIGEAHLHPLFFAHRGAVTALPEEVERLRQREEEKDLDTNFIVYLGRAPAGNPAPLAQGARLLLNPALRSTVSYLHCGTVEVAPRLGFANPPLDRTARTLLRQFVTPQPVGGMTEKELKMIAAFRDAMFLVAIR